MVYGIRDGGSNSNMNIDDSHDGCDVSRGGDDNDSTHDCDGDYGDVNAHDCEVAYYDYCNSGDNGGHYCDRYFYNAGNYFNVYHYYNSTVRLYNEYVPCNISIPY